MYKIYGHNSPEYTEQTDHWLDYEPDLSHAIPLLNKMIKELADVDKFYLTPTQTLEQMQEKHKVATLLNYLKSYKDELNTK